MTVADETRRSVRKSQPLTKRQLEVVKLLTEGCEVAEVARRLGCTQLTVRQHIEDIGERIPGPRTPLYRILVYGPALIAEAG